MRDLADVSMTGLRQIADVFRRQWKTVVLAALSMMVFVGLGLELVEYIPRYASAAERWDQVGPSLPPWLLALAWVAVAVGLTIDQEVRGIGSLAAAGALGIGWGFAPALIVGLVYGRSFGLGELGFVRGVALLFSITATSVLIYGLRARART